MTEIPYTFTISPPPREPWMADGLCTQVGPGPFFPEGSSSHVVKATREAVKVCRRCPVASECLEYALAHDERFGVWGGTTEHERARMRRPA